jgi:glutamine cyclotransferase
MVVAALAVTAAVVYAARPAREPVETAAPAAQQTRGQVAATPVHGYDVVREYPHDPAAFTQGLVYRDGYLFESTGLHGQSSLRKVELETGRVLQRRDVAREYFAEGLVDWGERLLQLTYTSNLGFVYDLDTFEPRATFRYEGQGWGLTHDGRRLIMSDGQPHLRFLDPDTFAEEGRIEVRDGDRLVHNLNELEMVRGQLYANIWFEDRIAIIDPITGRVTGWIDLAGLSARLQPPPVDPNGAGAVLNGIAYDPAGDRLFVTGKLWSRLFEIRVRDGR